jgi:predicted nucleic acid-binding protein
VADVLVPVPIIFAGDPQLIDPDDEMVLECAINAQAEVIVTFNVQDFLLLLCNLGWTLFSLVNSFVRYV